jgi:hypothetical protein
VTAASRTALNASRGAKFKSRNYRKAGQGPYQPSPQLSYIGPPPPNSARPGSKLGIEHHDRHGQHLKFVELFFAQSSTFWERYFAMSRSSANLSQGAFIFHPDNVFAVDTFEPSNGEMPLSHILKMLDKRVVHGSAA